MAEIPALALNYMQVLLQLSRIWQLHFFILLTLNCINTFCCRFLRDILRQFPIIYRLMDAAPIGIFYDRFSFENRNFNMCTLFCTLFNKGLKLKSIIINQILVEKCRWYYWYVNQYTS